MLLFKKHQLWLWWYAYWYLRHIALIYLNIVRTDVSIQSFPVAWFDPIFRPPSVSQYIFEIGARRREYGVKFRCKTKSNGLKWRTCVSHTIISGGMRLPSFWSPTYAVKIVWIDWHGHYWCWGGERESNVSEKYRSCIG